MDNARARRRRPPPWRLTILLFVLLGLSAFFARPSSIVAASSRRGVLAEYERRHAACGDDLEARFALAEWARREGLSGPAAREYRLVLAGRPDDETAYVGLLAVSTGTPPLISPSYEQTRRLLPPSFLEYETGRYVVFSDAAPAWGRTLSQRLERTHHQFHRFARRLGLRPLPLRHKLVCVLFADRADYQQFARAHDDVVDPWIAGYYAPTLDRIVFYHGDANPSAVEARTKLEEMSRDADSLRRRAGEARRQGRRDQARALTEHRQRYLDHIRRESRRVEDFTDRVNIATTVHEAVHQLMFHTEIQSPRVLYPMWISEGLATAFETDTPNAAFGPAYEYAPRREGFHDVLRLGLVAELEGLVTWADATGADASVHTIYHQSYAMVTWMCRFRRAELREYLHRLRLEPAGRIEAARALEIFEAAFGPAGALQAAWLRSERSDA